jgi:hypothetical protein
MWGQVLADAWPRFGSLAVGHFLGIAEEFFAGGQAAAALADILDIFELSLAVMLFVDLMGVAAIAARHGFALRITQVPGLLRQSPAGLTDISLLFHNPSS